MKLDNLPFNKDEYVILALSGGRDSMALLDLLIKSNYKVIVCHINHKRRIESEIEEKYIVDYCKNNNIICKVDYFDMPDCDNFQALAHDFRYDFFYQTAKEYNAKYILTAHHKDDLVETIILRLITGSNLYGYGGISYIRPYKDIYICRPLLKYSREDINNYVINNNIKYFEDESNSHDDYLRNRIRHNIVPLLKKENPNFLNNMSNYSNILKESFNYIRTNTINYLNNKLEIDIPSFINLDIALKKDIISYILEQYNINCSYQLIDDLISLINNPKPQLDYNLANDYSFLKRYDKCYISKKEIIANSSISLNLEESKLFLDKYLFKLTNNPSSDAKSIKIWYNNEDLPLTIRTRQNGDILTFKYGSKKVKDYFIDKKIVKEKRDTYPIILNQKGDIIAIYDLVNISKGKEYCYLVCEVNNE